MSKSPTHTVSGRGFDHPADSADLGLSLAINLASRAARERIAASFYVRTAAGNVVGRTDSFEDKSVNVLGPSHFAKAA